MRSFTISAFGAGAALFSPALAHAHEVYVLSPDTVAKAIMTPAFSPWEVIAASPGLFSLWALIGVLVVLAVFFISTSKVLERLLDPLFAKLPPYAPVVSRITIGVSFIAAAYFQAVFGPELPLSVAFAGFEKAVTILLAVVGFMITVGYYARVAAVGALVLFGIEVLAYGPYMLTYTNYFGELLILLILGAHKAGVHHRAHDARDRSPAFLRVKEYLMPYAFTILRVAFGISLLYASLYAKMLHNNLALDVAYAYPGLVAFFGFEPHFLVVGAGIVEIVVALFFILGIEIRFTSLFLLFWLTLSLLYFGEVVWPHIVLIGIPIAFIFYGYDKYSLEGRFFKRGGKEPVL